MKKVYNSLFVIGLLFISFLLIMPEVGATTLADFKEDLRKLEEEKRTIEENSAETQAKIKAAEEEIARIEKEIDETANAITRTQAEIIELEKDIEKKEQEIKDLVVFLQLSNSENFYLKYIFGAESFTDLIYRISVIEQLTTKNDALVDEMNALIKQNEEKIKSLEDKQVELDALNSDILVQIQQLGSKSEEYLEEGSNIDDRIEVVKSQIKFYEEEGCSDNDDVTVCSANIPPDSSFIRPVASGIITDNYGRRANPCSVCSSFHKGIDIGGNREGTPVYASAAGKVVYIGHWSCGGKVIMINHVVNGESIGTGYMHLYYVNVKLGDIVSQGQQIGSVGGGNTLYYDRCSTGAHLHFEVLQGGYNAATYAVNAIDPRSKVIFPAYGVWW